MHALKSCEAVCSTLNHLWIGEWCIFVLKCVFDNLTVVQEGQRPYSEAQQKCLKNINKYRVEELSQVKYHNFLYMSELIPPEI